MTRTSPKAAALALATVALAALLALSLGCSARAESRAVYYCPMHPEVTSTRPSDCPICGMHLVLPPSDPPSDHGASVPAGYTCPMHPDVVSREPGDCTKCGMHLVPAEPAAEGASPAALAPVSLDAQGRGRLGITVGEASVRTMAKTLEASGQIIPDETRVFRIIARVEGFVDQLQVPYAGLRVRKDAPLLGLYSLSLLSVQQQYLNAFPSDGRRYVAPPTRPNAVPSDEAEDREDTQRQRLKYWDFSDEQIDRIRRTGKTENSLILVAPSSGWVTDVGIVLGQRVSPGDLLMVVTDLSHVWAEAEVAEMDAPKVRIGMPMEFQPASMPGRSFRGRVKFSHPILDPQQHTMKVVVDLANADGALKPGMLGAATLRCEERRCLAVPEGAVLRSGEGEYAFVEKDGRLLPRKLVVGERSGGYVEVAEGLQAGDRVVTSASFLLDSESSLQAALRAAGGV
jgi:Cu(I)/Ag(I) efflux system membrane fusion protein